MMTLDDLHETMDLEIRKLCGGNVQFFPKKLGGAVCISAFWPEPGNPECAPEKFKGQAVHSGLQISQREIDTATDAAELLRDKIEDWQDGNRRDGFVAKEGCWADEDILASQRCEPNAL